MDAPIVIDISSSVSIVVQFVAAVVLALLMLLWRKAATWLGVKVDAEKGAILDQALHNGIMYAMSKALEVAHEKGVTEIEVDSELIAAAVEYAQDHVPETLAYFGLDDFNKIAELVQARIPLHVDPPALPAPAGSTRRSTSASEQ